MKTFTARQAARLAVEVHRELSRAGTAGNAEAAACARLALPEWKPFSITEQAVLVLLLDSGPMTREAIALALDESIDGRLRGILATLHARRVLLIDPERGYDVNAPAFRRQGLRRDLERLSRTTRPDRKRKAAPQGDAEELTDEQIASRIEEARQSRLNGHTSNGRTQS